MLTKRESHHSFMHNDSNEYRHEFAQLLLQPEGQTLKQGVKGKSNDEEH